MTSAHALGQFLRTLPHSAAATFLALFPIVDPFGGIPIFFTMTSSWTRAGSPPHRVQDRLWVFVILVTFLFFGRFVLHFFGISLPVLKIAGGLIVANTAWGMVTSHARITPEESHEARGQRRHFADSAGHAADVGSGSDRRGHGAGGARRQRRSVSRHGHWHRRDRAFRVAVLLAGRAAGAAAWDPARSGPSTRSSAS